MKKSTIKNRGAGFFALGALIFIFPAKMNAEVEINAREVGAVIDFGEIREGKVDAGDAKGETLTRTAVYLTSSGTYDQKLSIHVTIGGLFWYPAKPNETTPERLVRFGPGVGQAQGIYSFGAPENPFAKLQFGLFPIKYNPDANNLGEYLYRSGTYPGYLWTGGWSYVNSASYLAQGLRFSLFSFGGKFTSDFSLFMERDNEPTNDFSPGYIATFKPVSFLEIGAGVVWSHGLSLKSSRLSPETRLNAYDQRTQQPLSLNDRNNSPGYVFYGFGDARSDTMVVPDGDPRVGNFDSRNLQYVDTTQNGTPRNFLRYYTFKGIKTMARASMDIGSLLGINRIHPGDFKLYGEVALLGVENQPFYYEKKSERMPMMLGVNIPTFGLLSRLTFETEYHKSRFPNAIGLEYDREVPLPLDGESSNPFDYSDSAIAADTTGKFSKDDWHWSVYASRKITAGVTLCAQFASDHGRHYPNPEVKPTSQPTTVKPSDWYYIIRLEFGLF